MSRRDWYKICQKSSACQRNPKIELESRVIGDIGTNRVKEGQLPVAQNVEATHGGDTNRAVLVSTLNGDLGNRIRPCKGKKSWSLTTACTGFLDQRCRKSVAVDITGVDRWNWQASGCLYGAEMLVEKSWWDSEEISSPGRLPCVGTF